MVLKKLQDMAGLIVLEPKSNNIIRSVPEGPNEPFWGCNLCPHLSNLHMNKSVHKPLDTQFFDKTCDLSIFIKFVLGLKMCAYREKIYARGPTMCTHSKQ